MQSTPAGHRPHEGRLRLAAVALVGVALALRLLSLRHGAMSYDGLHSVTFAVQDSAVDVVRAVERGDGDDMRDGAVWTWR